MDGWNASKEHETYWKYRQQLNNWVFKVTWECFADLVLDLSRATAATVRNNEFALPQALLNFLADDINRYASHLFDVAPEPKFSFCSSRAWRLDDLCSHIRWWTSESVVAKLRAAEQYDKQSLRDRWMRTYLDLMTCDGSVAFRLAQEWLAIRDDLASSAGSKYFTPPSSSLAPWEGEFLNQLRAACKADLDMVDDIEATRLLAELAKEIGRAHV